MQQTQYLVVGLGIAGTLVSYELWKAGIPFMVIDDPGNAATASLVAGAVINPVNIHKWQPVSHHETSIPTALQTYQELETITGVSFIHETSMLLFHPDKESYQTHSNKLLSKEKFVAAASTDDIIVAERFFNNTYPPAKLKPIWYLDAKKLLGQWRAFLKKQGRLVAARFDITYASISSSRITYRDIEAQKIIFCEGAVASKNPFFQTLPFVKNRGEALLLSIPGLPGNYIYHFDTIRLVPARGNLFWCGSNYQWTYEDLQPDLQWKAATEKKLQQWLSFPFDVTDHVVAERPTTAGQEFLAGTHPFMPSVAIFNGLGTKGFSMGPLLAKDFCSHLITNTSSAFATPLSKWIIQ